VKHESIIHISGSRIANAMRTDRVQRPQILGLAVAALIGLVANLCEAAGTPVVTTFSDREEWLAAIGGSPSWHEDFDKYGRIRFHTVPAQFDYFSLFGEMDSTGSNLIVDGDTSTSINHTPRARLFVEHDQPVTVDMGFHNPIAAWGASFIGATDNEQLLIELLFARDGLTTTLDVPDAPLRDVTFFGFIVNAPLLVDRLKFKAQTSLDNGEPFGMDDVMAVSVPEPSTCLIALTLFSQACQNCRCRARRAGAPSWGIG
jgi:hypothetical protein